jgi:lipopolysaccharide export system protein LptC
MRMGETQTMMVISRDELARRYADAKRHSLIVRFLRFLIPFGSILALSGIIAIAIFDPFRTISTGLAVASFNLSGSQITMEQPHLRGFKQDMRPYEVNADKALQDLKNPTLLDLTDLKAKVGLADKKTALIEAIQGLYDSQAEKMTIDRPLNIKSDAYDVRMQSAKVDFKAGTVFTDQTVRVIMSTGTIDADKMEVIDSGRKIVFSGRVKTLLQSNDPVSGDKGEQKQ